MINEATIEYRLPGCQEPTRSTFAVNARSTEQAFEQAVEALKLKLIADVLALRPWAHEYSFGPASVEEAS